MSNKYALVIAVLNPENGSLLSDLHFGIAYIGNYPNVKKAFRTYISELVDVHIKDPVADREYSARGINPQSGMIEIYRIESVGQWV